MLTRFKLIPLPQVEFLDIKNHPPLFLVQRRNVHACSVKSDSLRPHGLQPLGSSVHGILQARTPQWVAISFSRGSSWPKYRTAFPLSPVLAGILYHWATWEALTNGDLTYNKRVTSILFSELLLYRLFLNNNQLRIICMPKRHIWRGGACPSLFHISHQHVYHIAKHSVLLPSLP